MIHNSLSALGHVHTALPLPSCFPLCFFLSLLIHGRFLCMLLIPDTTFPHSLGVFLFSFPVILFFIPRFLYYYSTWVMFGIGSAMSRFFFSPLFIGSHGWMPFFFFLCFVFWSWGCTVLHCILGVLDSLFIRS